MKRFFIATLLALVASLGALGVAQAFSLAELQQAFLDEVSDNLTIRVEGQGHTLKGHHYAEETTLTAVQGVVAYFEYRTAEEFEAIRVYLDGERVLTIPEIDGDGLDNKYGYINYVEVTVGLSGEPKAIVWRELQEWYWGMGCAFSGRCNAEGYGPFPGPDPRTYQGVTWDAFGEELAGCQVMLKQCYIDEETNEERCPLVCLYPPPVE